MIKLNLQYFGGRGQRQSKSSRVGVGSGKLLGSRRDQLGTTGYVPSSELEVYNAKALELIKAETGLSDEEAILLQKDMQEFFGGDYSKFTDGKRKSEVAVIDAGLDKMGAYHGEIYRGMKFYENSADFDSFANVQIGSTIGMKSITSWSDKKLVAEGFGNKSASRLNTVIITCTNNKTSVGVNHISKFGTSESEVLAKSTTQWKVKSVKITDKKPASLGWTSNSDKLGKLVEIEVEEI